MTDGVKRDVRLMICVTINSDGPNCARLNLSQTRGNPIIFGTSRISQTASDANYVEQSVRSLVLFCDGLF